MTNQRPLAGSVAPPAPTRGDGGADAARRSGVDRPAPMGRIGSLDSLRGLAAMVVVLYHFSLVVPGIYLPLQAIWPFRIILAGPSAVFVFFVLSGFVLYLSLQRHDRDDWLTFAARRMARLYPPVAVAVLLSAALYLLVDPARIPALQGGWLAVFSWTEPPSLELVGGHLLLLDTDRFHTLDNPMWSLVVEVRLSLLFPLVAAGVRRRPAATLIGCLILSAVARYMLRGGHQVGVVDPFFTLRFLDMFAIGAVLARYQETVARHLRRLPGALVVAVALFALCWQGKLGGFGIYICAVLLVAASFTYPGLARFYAFKPFVWLGERSFSLYLVHLPLVLAIVYALYGRIPIAVILAGAFPVCLLGAEVFWLGVERPSMRLSRLVGRRLSRRPRLDTAPRAT
jgi:peptidoglycan/LPS O-acetylase OafA/YrhL